VIEWEGGSAEVDVVVAATGGRPAPVPGYDAELPLVVDADMRVPGLEAVHAVGDIARVPHARFGELAFPHWDMAIGTGERAADAVAGIAGELDRLPYWWSDVGPRRLAEVGWAPAVAEWRVEDGLHVGREADGSVACVLVVDEPRRLRQARALLGGP
jgi:NADH dehydrogenase FAD-containing subunit